LSVISIHATYSEWAAAQSAKIAHGAEGSCIYNPLSIKVRYRWFLPSIGRIAVDLLAAGNFATRPHAHNLHRKIVISTFPVLYLQVLREGTEQKSEETGKI
jgi:hypothetical protein